MALHYIKSLECMSACMCACSSTIATAAFVRSSSKLEYTVGKTRDNEDQVRWLVKPEVVNAHSGQFASG